MQYKFALVSALMGLASAYYQPDTSKLPTGNAITRPLNEIVPGGKPFQITWTPSTPGKVSILLLKGPATNVKYLATIADSTDNTGSYTWNVDPSLTPQDTGYAIEVVSENGSYQYSSQIGIGKSDGSKVSSSSTTGTSESTTGTASASTSFGSVETAPPSTTTFGTAVCGALNECATTTTVASGAVGTNNVTSPIISPTVPITKPTSLATVAVPNGPTAVTSTAVIGVGAPGSSASGAAGAAPHSTGISSAFAAPGARLSGAAAVVAGLVGFLAL